MLNLALLIEDSAGIRLLRWLQKRQQYNLVYVLCSPQHASSTGVNVWSVAQGLGLPVLPASTIKEDDFPAQMVADGVDILLSLRAPYIIPPAVFSAPRIGAFNLHTGPLPEYAGRNVVNWAIFNGESSYGVTLHRVIEAVDGGDIAYQATIEITDSTSAFDLTAQCIRSGMELVKQLLEQACNAPKSIPAIPQDKTNRRYYGKDIPFDGAINWDMGATRLLRFIRACQYHPFNSPWGTPRAVISGLQVGILKAEHSERKYTNGTQVGDISLGENGLDVACGDSWLCLSLLSYGDEVVEPFEFFELREGMLVVCHSL